MNLPNLLTLSRVPLMFIIVWLMRSEFSGAATVAFALFVAAGVSDWLDGYYARKLGLVSNFGILMDALTDKILILGLMIALVARGQVEIYLVLLILGREFLITGLRLVAASKGVVMSAEKAGKQKTVTQILAVGGFLLSSAAGSDFAAWGLPRAADVAEILLWTGRILFWICVAMTLYSGAKYVRKYGRLVFGDEMGGAA